MKMLYFNNIIRYSLLFVISINNIILAEDIYGAFDKDKTTVRFSQKEYRGYVDTLFYGRSFSPLVARVGLIKTDNGGKLWVSLDPEERRIIGECYQTLFCTPDTGWLMTNTGTWRTSDGGVTWTRIFRFCASSLVNVGSLLLATFEMNGSGIIMYYSNDMGNTWALCHPGIEIRTIKKVKKISESNYVASVRLINGYDALAFSEDDAKTWKIIWSNKTDHEVDSFSFITPQLGWLATGNPASLLKSADGGISWTTLELPENCRASDLFFSTQNIGALVNSIYKDDDTLDALFVTTNGGLSWRHITDEEIIYDRIDNHGIGSMLHQWERYNLLKIALMSKKQNKTLLKTNVVYQWSP
jgi:photosystem II stability/assembly factor-like uncharacterized protein